MIISASRRADIPGFYAEWFMNRLQEGYCLAPNPFNPRQVARISLLPESVEAIVFWSKNPAPLFHFLPKIEDMGYRFYVLVTVNDYPKALEPNLPPLRPEPRHRHDRYLPSWLPILLCEHEPGNSHEPLQNP
jgi:hypothetical protein